MRRKIQNRNARAQVIAEFAATFPVLITFTILMIALIIFAFLYMNYRLKLTYGTLTSSLVFLDSFQFCGLQRPDQPADLVNNLVQSDVQRNLKSLGFSKVSVSTPAVAINPNGDGVSFLSLNTTVQDLPLISLGGMVPKKIATLNQTTVFASGNTSPIAAVYVCAGNVPPNRDLDGAGGILVPAYGGGRDPFARPAVAGFSIVYTFPQPIVPGDRFITLYSSNGGFRPI